MAWSLELLYDSMNFRTFIFFKYTHQNNPFDPIRIYKSHIISHIASHCHDFSTRFLRPPTSAPWVQGTPPRQCGIGCSESSGRWRAPDSYWEWCQSNSHTLLRLNANQTSQYVRMNITCLTQLDSAWQKTTFYFPSPLLVWGKNWPNTGLGGSPWPPHATPI